MLLNKLKLNSDKTELLLFQSYYRSPSESFFYEKVSTPADKAMNIGVIVDKTMTMSPEALSIIQGISQE